MKTKDATLLKDKDFNVGLDTEIQGDEASKKLKDLPLFQQFSKPSCREHPKFFSTQKCCKESK